MKKLRIVVLALMLGQINLVFLPDINYTLRRVRDFIPIFVSEALRGLQRTKGGGIVLRPEFYTNKLIPWGNIHGEEMARLARPFLKNYPEIKKELISVLGKVSAPAVTRELIKILEDSSESPETREDAAIALSHKSDIAAETALRKAVGKDRVEVFDKFGVWVFDIRVEDKFKFSLAELEVIKAVLRNIPRSHIERGIKTIVRRYPSPPKEIIISDSVVPDEVKRRMEEERASHWKGRVLPKGSYDELNYVVNVEETDELTRVIYHEAGHGFHFYTMNPENWRQFAELYNRSRSQGADWHFAYPYGSLNFYEDCATIYELLFIAPEELSASASRGTFLRQKIELVKKYFPEGSIKWPDGF